MGQIGIDWHFSRKELAEQLFNVFKAGFYRQAIFAPRRMGKTEFVEMDFVPYLASQEIPAIYIDMWRNKDAPHEEVLRVLTQALSESDDQKTFWEKYKGKLKLSVSVPHVGQIGAELESASKPRVASANELSRIADCFDELVKRFDGKVAFLFDEIQHLATSDNFLPLSFAIRSAFERHRKVPAVFTGSSRHGLFKLFSDHKSPFFGASDTLTLPSMGKEFVEHLGNCYTKVTVKKMDIEAATKAFELVSCNPAIMMAIMQKMIFSNSNDIQKMTQDALSDFKVDEHCEMMWNKLTPVERDVYSAIIRDERLFSRKEQTPAQVNANQRAVNSLCEKGFLFKAGHGDYQPEHQFFEKWVIDHKLERPEPPTLELLASDVKTSRSRKLFETITKDHEGDGDGSGGGVAGGPP